MILSQPVGKDAQWDNTMEYDNDTIDGNIKHIGLQYNAANTLFLYNDSDKWEDPLMNAHTNVHAITQWIKR